MVEDMTPREEQNGTGAMLVWTSVVVVAIGVGLLVWFFVPGFNQPTAPNLAANGPRGNETQGMSATAHQTQALQRTASEPTDAAKADRNRNLTASAAPKVDFSPDQMSAIKSYVAQHGDQRIDDVNFTTTVGAIVPANAPLRAIPPQLGQSLSSFKNDQYVIVGNQFLIVEKDTRRIVVIVPVTT